MNARDEKPKGQGLLKFLLITVLVGVALVLVLKFDPRELLRSTLAWIGNLGAWGPLLFIAIYIVASVLFIPASVLTLGAGALFGIVRGSLYVIIGATLGATAAFLVGRYLARDWVARQIEANQKFKAIDQAVGREGGKIVLLTRLSPVFPFNLLNYAFGVTQVRLRSYFLASAIGMIPGTILYVYIGSVAGMVAAEGTRARTPAEWGLLVFGLLATISVTILITRAARTALQARITG